MKQFLVVFGIALSFSAGFSARASSFLNIEEYRSPSGELSLFIRPVTDFEKSYMELDASFDQGAAVLEHPAKDLWIFKVPQPGPHALALDISLVDAKQSDRLSESLRATEATIASVCAALAQATDPQEVARLQGELSQNQNLKIRLLSELQALKNFIGHENYYFQAFTNSTSLN